MKRTLIIITALILTAGKDNIPLPSAPQLRWQENERAMFIHLSPATWQWREYDNRTTPLEKIKLPLMNTDQWCEVAQSWGAKEIILVAKHAGGFCWWPTDTTPYGIKNTPYKDGRGDVLKELALSCKKYGIDLGIYVYPGDEQWGAGIGSGGTTADPAKQEAYNKIYRQQLTEALSSYGPITEVWFDGNCNISVNDILDKYAKNSVIFQSPKASIRWVGNEDGYAPYPNWYTLKKSDLATGEATALLSDPYGDAYAPVEAGVPFLKNGAHKWFWAPDTDQYLMSMEMLMTMYYKSVGRGGLLLLNASPDTTGLIPASHVELYRKFGEEINSRFNHPLASTSGKGDLQINFNKPTTVNHVVTAEDLSKGQRVLDYTIFGLKNGLWTEIVKGKSIGNKRIDHFTDVQVEGVKIVFNDVRAKPQIKQFSLYNVVSEINDIDNVDGAKVILCWEPDTYTCQWKQVEFDITKYVTAIGQYEINFSTLAYDLKSKESSGLDVKDVKLDMYGKDMPRP